MSELEKYNRLYDELIVLFGDLHNSNVKFNQSPSFRNSLSFRKALKNIRIIGRDLLKSSTRLYHEELANKKAEVQRKKDEVAYRKANPLPKGRKKGTKNGQLNRTTKTTIR